MYVISQSSYIGNIAGYVIKNAAGEVINTFHTADYANWQAAKAAAYFALTSAA